MEQTQSTPSPAALGGNHDVPFVGFQPYHFSTRQFARLLVLRGEIQDSPLGSRSYADDLDTDQR
jgi:hypothetical protein